jgi:UDP-glucose 4-epimerase
MKYVVTGGCGFVGAAVCRTLVERASGVEVTVLDINGGGDPSVLAGTAAAGRGASRRLIPRLAPPQ